MDDSSDKIDKILRGKRIKEIREKELHMNKAKLASLIGISGQFLGLVEEGKGNLVYKSLKKLMKISGHSADYILFGLDDNIIKDTRKLLNNYTDLEILEGIEIIKKLSVFIKNTDNTDLEEKKRSKQWSKLI